MRAYRLGLLAAGDLAARSRAVERYRRWVGGFVPTIDALVLQMEHENAFATAR